MYRQAITLLTILVFLSLLLSCSEIGESGESGELKPAGAVNQAGVLTELSENAAAMPPIENRGAPVGDGQSNKRALLVGINKYNTQQTDFKDLKGCVNDVQNMKAILTGKFEFPEANINMLTDEQATYDNIIAAFKKLIKDTQSDDIVVFHYSGHGSQMPDQEGDKGDENDNWDETIVPHDSRVPGKYDISDDVLNSLLRLLGKKTKNITFIFDSCHSGTASRGAGASRSAPADTRPAPDLPDFVLEEEAASRGGTSARGSSDLNLENPEYALVSGSLSTQSSYEHFAKGESHGALTYFFIEALKNMQGEVTYRDVMDFVRTNVNLSHPKQTPQLEGANMDQLVFNDRSVLAQPYVIANHRSSKTVRMQTGTVHGATVGSVYHIFPPGLKNFDDRSKAIAVVKITKLKPFEATADYVSKTVDKIPTSSRAIETEHVPSDKKIRVYIKDMAASSFLSQLPDKLAEFKHIEIINEPSGYTLLVREADGYAIIENANTEIIQQSVETEIMGEIDHLVDQITLWARWYNLAGLRNSPSPKGIEVSLRFRESDGGPLLNARSGNSLPAIKREQIFEVVVKNVSSKDMYISILDISTDGSVSLQYPDPAGASELLAKGEELVWPREAWVEDDFHKDSVTDLIKVFATDKPVDFNVLTQERIRGSGDETSADNALGAMFDQAALGKTRGGRRPVSVKSWETAEASFVITKE